MNCCSFLRVNRNDCNSGKELLTRERERIKNIGATACRAWARAETFNGLQKVLENVYIPDSKT